MARRKQAKFLTRAREAGWRGRVTIEGTEDLAETLVAMDRTISGPILLAALDRASAITADVMSQLAPVDPTTPLDLRDNIGREVTRLSRRRAQVAVGPKKNVWYGMFQEIGTSYHPPQPFMRPALDSTRDTVVQVFGETLRRAIEEVAGGS